MGGWVSYVWWGGDPDSVNSFSGLTKREVYIVQKSWAPVHANALGIGTELFRRLFNTFPDTKEFFRVARRLPEEKYIHSAQFKAHIINLMTSLNLAIVNLNQPEISAAMMNKLGESHAKRKIEQIHFMLTMGGWFSYVWWGGDPDAVNPVSGLTKREIYAVQRSWAPVNANPLANGTEVLRRLYNTFPETKEFFKMVRKLPEEEYVNNPQFKAHVINLMTSLNLAVTNLNQPEVVAAMMHKLGESHGRRQIKQTHFMGLKEVIVKMFIEVLQLDNDTLEAWSKAVDFWYKHIFETLDSTESR